MGTSKKRGGAKAHRKRIETRNIQVKAEQTAMQKFFNESLKRQVEELKKKHEAESGTTNNQE
jgi:hypothetical protein